MNVLGNGETRSTINVDSLVGPKIGCNAIYRDYRVDHLVCVDNRMVVEAIEADYNQHCKIYTRSKTQDSYTTVKNIRCVPDLPYAGIERPDEHANWGSGPYAVLLAAKLSNTVDLIGFDLYSQTHTVNNIYKGTKNYIAAEKTAIDPRYWIYQISKVFEYYPKVKFTIYQPEGWNRPKLWKKPNVFLDKLDSL